MSVKRTTDFLPGSSQPTFTLQNSYNNPAQLLIGPTIYGAGYSRFPHVVDELRAFRLEGSHEAGLLKEMKNRQFSKV